MISKRIFCDWAAVALFVLVLLCSLFYRSENSVFLGAAGLAAVGMLGVAMFGGIAVNRNLRVPPTLLVLWGFWAWWLIAGFFSPVAYVSQVTVYELMVLPVTATTVWIALQSEARVKTALEVVLLCVALPLCVYALYQVFATSGQPKATFINRNSFAAFLVLLALSSIPRLFRVSKVAVVPLLGWLCLVATLISMIGSRGAITSLLIGLAVVLCGAFVFKRQGWRIAAVVVALGAGFLIADQLTGGTVSSRVSSLQAPMEASSVEERILIWKASLSMAGDYFWFGAGPGMYWILYPQYQSPLDRSAGFYAHNDLLQYCIEVGLPGVVLFLLVGIIVTWGVIRFLKKQEVDGQSKLQVLGFWMAVVAVVGHSMLTFNLYIMPILVVLGAILGVLANMTHGSFRRFLRLRSIKVLVPLVGLGLVAGSFYAQAILGGRSFAQAESAMEAGAWNEAVERYQEAIHHWPDVDGYYYRLAWALAKRSTDKEDIELAFDNLDVAQSLNPYRPQTYLVRAKLLEQIDNEGSLESEAIVGNYRRTLEFDPGYLMARFSLARYLLGAGEIDEGVQVLEQGLDREYPATPVLMNYYRLTAEMRRIQKDMAGYESLMKRVRLIAEKLQRAQGGH